LSAVAVLVSAGLVSAKFKVALRTAGVVAFAAAVLFVPNRAVMGSEPCDVCRMVNTEQLAKAAAN
jgi:hypothetical protein